MKKVIIIGCPGSGKSTFSKALHRITKLPLFHLDMLFWNPDGTQVEKSLFLERLSHALQNPQWIIDGNYASTMELRIQACDTVIFLDYPLEVCLSGIRSRKGTARSDLPWVEPEADDLPFMEFVKSYASESRPQVLELLSKYPEKKIYIFTSREEANAFLVQISS